MRKPRTAGEVRFKVTLSFSAHSTGWLALLTSTASGSAGAGALRAAPASPTVSASTARRPLPARSLRLRCRPMTATLEAGPRRTGRSSVEHTIDIPGVGSVGQRGNVGRHLGRAQPAIKREALAFPKRDIAAVAAKRV